jgi:tetratricopeptide (TPR) repeat protein
MCFKSFSTLIFVLFFFVGKAQIPASLKLPRNSPKSSVTQRIGFTDVTIDYNSPAVKERDVWNSYLIPQGGKPYPWRAGANENTTITFTDDVLVEGKPLAAGTYGFHIIPSKDDFTLIFSNNHTSWGSFFYNENEDALRVSVKSKDAEFREWLSYDFEVREIDNAVVVLHWERLKIPFKIKVDNETTMKHIKNQLRSSAAFTSEGFFNAANFCLQHKMNQEDAIQWIDRALKYGRDFQRLEVKAGLLKQLEKEEEAKLLIDEAFDIATPAELYGYCREQLKQENVTEAERTANYALKYHKKHWQTQLSVAEVAKHKGNNETAKKYYEAALETAPKNWQQPIKSKISTIKEN